MGIDFYSFGSRKKEWRKKYSLFSKTAFSSAGDVKIEINLKPICNFHPYGIEYQ